MREGKIERNTHETQIKMQINLDGTGTYQLDTGIGFFDHMLSHLAKHGFLDLTLTAKGDLEIDPHHTVEDVGITLGEALRQGVGDKQGLTRYGQATLPMDEVLVLVAIDFGGRPFFKFNGQLPAGRLGEFDLELVPEFFRAVAVNAGMNLHIRLLEDGNTHHVVEGIFKAFGRALAMAVSIDERLAGSIPSTKGVL